MGIFDNLFGKSKSELNNKSGGGYDQALKSKYNVMKNITLDTCEKYKIKGLYKLIESGIYQDLQDREDAKYRMVISYELENGDSNNQYPLEDILDKYLMYVSDHLQNENRQDINRHKIELGGYLEKMKEAQTIFGKQVYNQDFLDENGKVRVKLIIE